MTLSHSFNEVHDLIPFVLMRSIIYPLHPDEVFNLFFKLGPLTYPFTLMRSIILSPLFWSGPLSYPLHLEEVHYLIPLILMRSIILSPSSWWGQLRTCRLSQTGSPLVKYSHVQTTTDSASTQDMRTSTSWQKHVYVQTITKCGFNSKHADFH